MAQAASLAPALDQSKPIEEPLSQDELRVMAQHLRFLREHRKVLNLKVNAQEDLLLNGARQPTRRGVCQHLLAKVDRARVFGAAQRLEPAAATRLVEGVLAIAPDVDYLLLYLDCVRRSASQQQAISALAEALGRLDFSQVSTAQLRRVLDLIAELFQGRDRVRVLLGLLSGSAFRDALDQSAAELPEALRELVLPLRAAQAAVLQGKPRGFSEALIARGVELLLEGDERSLASYAPGARRRLFAAGLRLPASFLCSASGARAIAALLESLSEDGREHGSLALALARTWVRAGAEREARELLSALASRYPDFRQPRRWLEALSAPRLGRVALITEPRRNGGEQRAEAEVAGRLSGVSLETMDRLSVYIARDGDDPEHRRWFELLRTLSLPGVAPLREHGVTDEGRPWFALSRFGRSLSGALRARPGLEADVALFVCAEAAALLSMLAELGVLLPDAGPARFELGAGERAWLVDLHGADRPAGVDVRAAHARYAGELCAGVLGALRNGAAPDGLLDRITGAGTIGEVVQLLDGHRR